MSIATPLTCAPAQILREFLPEGIPEPQGAADPVPLGPEPQGKLLSALRALDPSMGRDEWVAALRAFKAGGGALEYFDAWSSGGANYVSTEDVARTWDSFAAEGGTTVRTLYKMAHDAGWAGYQHDATDIFETIAMPSLVTEAPSFMTTDIGNAERLLHQHGENLRYVGAEKTWIVWDGARWIFDSEGRVMTLAKRVARSIHHEAAEESDPDRRKLLARWAIQSETRSRLVSMLALAECDRPVSPNSLDANPFLLNCRGSAIDLRIGRPKTPERSDLATKCTGISYQPGAPCPRWLDFLNTVMGGDVAMVEFLQRAVGYTLTGSTSEQVLFFTIGTGANGKSVFQKVLQALLGDYAMQAAAESLMVGRRDGHAASPDIARLRGARAVLTSEIEDGQRLAESLVKQLTGGDTIVARHNYGQPFEFTPAFKIWIAANHRPVIRGDDYAIWRRIRLVPFDVTIPPDERDGALIAKLLRELPGILNWAIEGCLAWQREGLSPPPEVSAATEAYRNEMDALRQWLDECCVLSPGVEIGASALYVSYKMWAESAGCYVYSQTKFGRKIRDLGFSKVRKSGGFAYVGIIPANPAPFSPVMHG